ncbi:MAG: hypothetical protein C7B47_03435 [Sulfobacillus thermosulfidooxidans]|uniref:glucose-6-phosphate isomerase n=1 Tax=Sulfobacillus thermosulfidooxidans TaxID=28034 RepID=A0A2T2X3E9_SULTH|nr:MAG: hypothetical protein C7B47_03435 [Sulfobacillus thermosulfidooxidans]
MVVTCLFDLTTQLGIPFSWTGHLDDPLYPLIDAGYDHHVARSLEELRPFLEDPDAKGPLYVYHVYEGVHLKSEQAKFRRLGFGVDVTMLWPGCLTREWSKTAGHIHTGIHRSDLFGEMVEVVHGEALFLLQAASHDRISEILLISATKGDWVVIPPGYSHVTMNTGPDVLALTFVHAQDIYLDYEDLARHRGAGLWIGPEGYRLNPSYAEIGVIRELRARDLIKNPVGLPLYQLIGQQPDKFRFLIDPQVPSPWV